MSALAPPLETISRNDHGPLVVIADYILVVFSAIVVIARGIARYRLTRIVNSNDLITFSALVLAIAQSICVQLAVSHGLGRHEDSVSPNELVLYSKFNYASQILLVTVLACAKTSITQLIEAIQPQRPVLLACRGLMIVIGLWAVSSILALALQCKLPSPWDFTPRRCINQAALYYFIGVMNIVTDLIIVALPVPMMWNVQVSTEKKLLVIGLFAIRIIVPAVAIVQLVFLQPYLHSNDQTWENVQPSIWNQVVMNLSIITACIPSLKRVMSDLQTGLTALTVTEDLELSLGGKGGYGSASKIGDAKTSFSVARNNSTSNDKVFRYGRNSDKRVGHMTSTIAGNATTNRNLNPRGAERSDSQEQLREDAIVRTVEYNVEYEETGDRSESGHSM